MRAIAAAAVADLGTQDIATMTPPELDTTRHTYIGNTYTGQLYN